MTSIVGVTWTDFFPDTPPGLNSALPTAIVVAGLYDTADLPELLALIATCSRAYCAAVLAAKRKARRELLAKQRRAIITLLQARARAAEAADFRHTAACLSTPDGLSGWKLAGESDSDLN